MTINPLVQSEETAKKILDEMLEAHKKYLPQFVRYLSTYRKRSAYFLSAPTIPA